MNSKYNATNDKAIIYWFQQIILQRRSNMIASKYCWKYNLDANIFGNMVFKIFYTGGKNPDEYEIMVDIVREYHRSGMSLIRFSESHMIDIKKMRIYTVHVRYKDIVTNTYGPDCLKYNWIPPFGEELLPKVEVKEVDTEKKSFFVQRPLNTPALKGGNEHLVHLQENMFPQQPEVKPLEVAVNVEKPKISEIIPVEEIKPTPIAARNDIEVLINAGIKVVLAPEVSSEQLVKIITLLRSL